MLKQAHTSFFHLGAGIIAASSLASATAGAVTAPTPIQQHAVVQQGLAIGLALTQAQSQGVMVRALLLGSMSCLPLPGGGGSVKVKTRSAVNPPFNANVEVYFDAACAHRYMAAALKVSGNSSFFNITETASFYSAADPTKAIGKLTITEAAVFSSGTSIELAGQGVLKPAAAGTLPADVAFACAIPNTFAGVQTFHCEGAIAKTFKSLKVDLASTAPLMVKASTTGTVTKASFTGSSQLVQGASNALGVTVPNQTSTKILGAFTPVGTATISAGAVLPVTLFPTKVGWAVGDVAHAVSFKIAGLNNSYTVTLTGAKNPKNSIDATGTGTVVIGTKSVPVSLWTLQD